MQRNLLPPTRLIALLLLLMTLPVLAEDGNIVIRGARVLTMDNTMPEATSMAIVGGSIAAIGSAGEMEPYLDGAQVFDIEGGLVLPGFQDGHNHLVWSATELQGVDLTGVETLEDLRSALIEGMESLPADAWLRASGWDISAFTDATAADLDVITGPRPTILVSADAHSAWVNSAALEAAGIGPGTSSPPGGRIEVDAVGNPIGLFRESAMALVTEHLPDYPDEQVDAGLVAAQEEAHSYGITALFDPAAKEWMLRGYERLDQAAGLTLRVSAAVEITPQEGTAGVQRVLDLQQRFRSERLRIISAKLFVDGVIESETAALLEAYGDSNEAGELLFEPMLLQAVAIAADEAELQLHAQAIGDRAIRATLDAYEAARDANGARDRRHQITHLELIDPEDIPRFAELEVLANIQALWAYPDTYITDLTEPKIGPVRSEMLYPFGALRDAGAVLVGGSDWSVSSMNPLEAIQVGVTRQDPEDPNGRILTPQHRLTVMDMLRAYTINAAFAAFDEQDSGSLVIGKRADIVVLDRDITNIPPTEISTASVLLTIAGGRIVHHNLEGGRGEAGPK